MKPFSTQQVHFMLYDHSLLEKEKAGWLIAPCTISALSDEVENCNFDEQLNRLRQAQADHQLLNFGHWAVGFVKIVIVPPTGKAYDLCKAIENALEDYPLLNDMLYHSDYCPDDDDSSND